MITIYASGATRSRRPLWACEEVGLPYQVVPLTFPPRLHHPEFLAISPAGALPAMTDGDVVLVESLAICEYVSRKAGGDLTLDPGEAGYYDYLSLLQFGEATLAPPLGWARRLGAYSEQVIADARTAFGIRLRLIEHTLADGRAFLAADRLTLADISVGYTLGLSRLSGLDDLIPPTVLAYEDRLKARPAYRRAYAA